MKRLALLIAIATPLAAQTITPAAIRAHVRFLADDLLEGRETGTRGYDVAAEYVTSQFEAAGLRPVSDSWFQPLALRTARVTQQSMSIDGVALTPRTDFNLSPDFLQAASEITAPVAVAGYGIVAPELYHDDYRMVDVRGRIVLVISGAPPGFAPTQRAYYSSTALKTRTAAARGAIGVLFVNSHTDERRVPFARRVQQEGRTSMRFLADGRPHDVNPSLKVVGRVSQDIAAKLLEGSAISGSVMLREAELSTTYALKLKPTVAVRIATTHGEAKSANVVGMLPGSDPAVRDEYVVVSAHLDHLGISSQAGARDSIHNGAQDNASGVAVLIEMARALATSPPRRPVLFVALTGEEKGRQGSSYFARHPPVPKASLVANVNMDMFLMLFMPRDLLALGGEHSTLGALASEAAREEGFEIAPDPMPEEVRFIRSDQFSFVEVGIPAIHVKSGVTSANPQIDGAAVTSDWLKRIYHSPADDMTQPLDFAFAVKYAQTNLRLIAAIANAPHRPSWHPGDFFGHLAAP